ncbi:MAG: acetate--CoA ligase family protein [Deltaproteobacteria bacterium]|nr:acetate--CoA ligase family protein [Deltaproteobacteria bacterium]
MQLRHISELTGPNVWANSPVAEALVDLGEYEDLPTSLLPGFTERLVALLPGLGEHRCSVGEPGGFVSRLREGTWLGHVLEHVALELHSRSHLPVGYGRARETSERGVYRVAVKCEEPAFGRACLEAGHALLLAVLAERAFDVEGELARLSALADRICLGPSTRAIVMAARARGIPHRRLSAGNLVQLGQGRAQRRIWTAETDRTSAVAESIAQDKQLTRRLLAAAGVPVPEGRVVSSASDAWAAAEELGGPVVVKPVDANHGRGVSVRLESRAAVEAAYGFALGEGSAVLVERFVPGVQFRVLVVGGRAIAAAGGEAKDVEGDGTSTIAELVDRANQDPRRGEESARALTPIVLDSIALELLRAQGFTPDAIPPAGERVAIHLNGDLTVDVTDELHPEVAHHAELTARVVGLDVAGIDLMARTLSRPLEAQGGAIVEVNASPGLAPHLNPLRGRPRPVGEAIAALLFAEGEDGRIPVIAVTGGEGSAPVARGLADLLEASGRRVGFAGSAGLITEGRRLESTDARRASSVQRALESPFLDAVVFEVDPRRVLVEGLGVDRVAVAVVLPLPDIESVDAGPLEGPDRIEKALASPVDIVLPKGFAVLPAGDARLAGFAPRSPGQVLFYGRAGEPALEEAIARGDLAVRVDARGVHRVLGGNAELLAAGDFAGTRGDVVGAMAAAGLALGLDAALGIRHAS